MSQLPSTLRGVARFLTPLQRGGRRSNRLSTLNTAVFGLRLEPLESRLLLTALDDYIAAPDANYAFQVTNTYDEDGYTVLIVDMTSQQWRSPEEVDRPLWKHWLQIVVPDTVTDDTALLFINGGNNSNPEPQLGDSGLDQLIAMALTSNAVTVTLPTVPNQSLIFSDEFFLDFTNIGPDGEPTKVPIPRSEDAIIAYTFDKFIDNYPNLDDNTWPLLLPMVKSAVRAMDTVQALGDTNPNVPEINDFVVTGGSKRGWTTWLTAAVDDRVKAIIPAVADLLNFGQQLIHHKEAYVGVTDFIIDGYSLAIADYVLFDLPERFQSEAGEALLEIVDPYLYRDRLVQPKYLVNSPGDEFFVTDSSQFYFDQLPGDNYLRYVPNTSHGLNQDAVDGITQFFRAIVEEQDLPELSWTFENDGNTITAITPDTASLVGPNSVKLWQASNPNSRDFRYGAGLGPGGGPAGPIWTSTVLVDQGGGTYVANLESPETGARAFFIEMVFESGDTTPFTFTTEVSVIGRTEGAVNVAPIAGDDSVNTTSTATVSIDVLTNDQDPDGSIDPASLVIVDPPDFGNASVNAETNQIVYTSNPGFVGADTLSYRVRDNDGTLSNAAVVTINVSDLNTSPTAVNDDMTTFNSTSVLIDVLNNDSDSDGDLDPTSVSIQTAPNNGTATPDAVTGKVTYTPTPGFVGIDTFTYVVDDTQAGTSNIATVTVEVLDIGIGEDSVGVYNPGTGTFFLRFTNNSGVADVPAFNFGSPNGQLPIVGDWNGDGVSTIGLYNRNTGQFRLRNSNDAGPVDVPLFIVGSPEGLPIVGDWNGDGVDSVGVYNPATATFQLVNGQGTNPGPVTQFQFGPPGWVPIAGDWDGDGSDSIGLYNAQTATFFLRNSNSTGVADVIPFNYGLPNWTPVIGDFDGDGDDTVGVVNQDTATFFLRNQNDSGVADVPGFNYGIPGWSPLIGRYYQAPNQSASATFGGGGPDAGSIVPSGVAELVGFSLVTGLDPRSVGAAGASQQGASVQRPVANLVQGPIPASNSTTDATLEDGVDFGILTPELESLVAQALSTNNPDRSQLDQIIDDVFEDLDF